MTTEEHKNMIINLIVSSVTEHPEWFGEVVQAMQYGLSQALLKERTQASNLAMGLVTMVQWEQSKNKKFPYYHNIQSALHAMYNWYGSAFVWKQIEPLLEDHDDED